MLASRHLLRQSLLCRLSQVGLSRRWLQDLQSKRQVLNEFRVYMNDFSKDDSKIVQLVKVCSTGLLSELPQSRVSLADYMFKTMNDKNVPVPVMLYNTLLQVYLRNRHSFSPSSFLQKMQEEDISPNRGTLFLLLQAYCQQGNMDGAKDLLEEIRSNDIPINEHIYSSLISCHAESGDMESACQLLDVMRENGLEPGQTTYSALLSGYAYQGDIEAIKQTIEMMRGQRVFVGHNMYIDMLDAMSRGGHSDKITELLDMIRNKHWMFNDLLEKLQVFAGRGDLSSVVCILQCLHNMEIVGEAKASLIRAGEIAMRLISVSDNSLDDVLSSMSAFTDIHVSSKDFFETIIRQLFDTKEWDKLQATIEEMAKQGCTVRPHYIYPALADYANKKDFEGIMNWLIVCHKLNVPIDRYILQFSLRAVNDDFAVLLKSLSERNILRTEGWLSSIVEFLCLYRHHDINTFCQVIQTLYTKETLPLLSLLSAISKSQMFTSKPHSECLGQLLLTLYQFASGHEEEFKNSAHVVVSRTAHQCPPEDTLALVQSLLQHQTESFHPIHPHTYGLVLSVFRNNRYVKDFHKLVKLMQSYNVPLNDHHHKLIVKMSSTDNPASAVASFEAMKRKGEDIDNTTYCHYVLALAKAKRTKQAIKHYNNITQLGFTLSSSNYSQLIAAVLNSGNLTAALNIRSDMEEMGLAPNRLARTAFIEAYSRRGDIDKAQEEFKSLVDAGMTPTDYTYHKLMEGYTYHGDVSSIRSLFEEVKSHGININRSMVSSLINGYLNQNNLEEAVVVLDEEDVLPELSTCIQLVNECEKEGKRDWTNKVLQSLSSMGISQKSIDHIFVFALLRAGHLEEAITYFKSNDMRVIDITMVSNFAESLAKAGNVEIIKMSIALLEKVGVSSSSLYVPLIKAYAHNNDIGGILATKTELESSSDTQPDQTFYTVVAQLLQPYGGSSEVSDLRST